MGHHWGDCNSVVNFVLWEGPRGDMKLFCLSPKEHAGAVPSGFGHGNCDDLGTG